MMKTAEIHTLREPGWSSLLGQFGDATIYQTHTCGRVLWEKAELSHVILRDKGVATGLAQVEVIKAPLIRAGTALVFWGPIWKRDKENEDVRVFSSLVKALRDEYVERQGMLLRIIPNGFGQESGIMRLILEEAGFRYKGKFYRTYLMDISPSPDQVRKQLNQKWRNCLNRAAREDLTVHNGTGLADYDVFLEIFSEMHKRKGFTDISIDPFRLRAIQQNLPDELKAQVFICQKGETPLAGAVVSAIGDTSILLLAATNSDGRRVKASYLLQWRIIEWLKSRHIRFYDLGGISPSHPSVNHFKAGLGGSEVSHAGIFEFCTNPLSSLFDRSLGIMKTLGKSMWRTFMRAKTVSRLMSV